jgi:two-component system chemotaxis response regulator CheB
MPVRVLIVDDSAVVRTVLRRELARYPDLEVVATATDPFTARNRIVELEPDVLTLDIEMPRMDGVTFLKKLMRYYPMPVVVVSSLTREGSATAVAAMEAGAVDVVAKPGGAVGVGEIAQTLAERVRAAACARVDRQGDLRKLPGKPAHTPVDTKYKVIAVGASTGGTQAIQDMVCALPPAAPGIIVVLHIPKHFSYSYAKRLDSLCALDVKEAENGESVTPGKVLIAPGDRHLLLNRNGAKYNVVVKDGPSVNRHRPSVDVLFRSVARTAGSKAVGVILTGMGSDGAAGLKEMRDAGALTVAQDEASCVVFGMPKVAIENGGASAVVPLDKIPKWIVDRLASS